MDMMACAFVCIDKYEGCRFHDDATNDILTRMDAQPNQFVAVGIIVIWIFWLNGKLPISVIDAVDWLSLTWYF